MSLDVIARMRGRVEQVRRVQSLAHDPPMIEMLKRLSMRVKPTFGSWRPRKGRPSRTAPFPFVWLPHHLRQRAENNRAARPVSLTYATVLMPASVWAKV